MVIHFEWHQTAMEQNSRSSLPLTGEDTGLEALASPLVGYLGKVSRTHVSSHCCHPRKAEFSETKICCDWTEPFKTTKEKKSTRKSFKVKGESV